MSGEMTLTAPKLQQSANLEVRGHRKSLKSHPTPHQFHKWLILASSLHETHVQTWRLVHRRRQKEKDFSFHRSFFLSFFFFNKIIVSLFPLHVAQSGGRSPVLTGFFFFIVVLDCREIFKTSLNSLQNLASRSVGGRFQHCDGFTGKDEWVSQTSTAQWLLFTDVMTASLLGSCVCLAFVL